MPKGVYKHKHNPCSEETKRKIGLANKGNISWLKGKKRDVWWLKGRVRTDEVKRRIGEANKVRMKELWQNPDYRKKMVEAHEGYKPKKESIYKQSVAMKAKWKDPKFIKQMVGCNASNWKGGKSFEPYPLGWRKTFKEQIRYRDGYKCQGCGIPEVECKNKLHVHHIDYDKQNLDINNLISLCASCHMKTNYNREYWEENFAH